MTREIRDHLTPYLRYERLHQILHRFAPTSKLSDPKEYLESIGEAVQHFGRLKLAVCLTLAAPLECLTFINVEGTLGCSPVSSTLQKSSHPGDSEPFQFHDIRVGRGDSQIKLPTTVKSQTATYFRHQCRLFGDRLRSSVALADFVPLPRG